MNRDTVTKAVKGTWILTIASLFSELLSAIYRIPLQNIVGDRGYFIYQQVYPIYGVFSVLALTGLPVVLSKTFAQQKNDFARNKLLRATFLILLVASIFVTAIFWKSSHLLANFMGDPRLYHEIRTVSLAFLLIPFEASLRGLFQSDLIMEPSAYSQVIEQFVRIALILVAAILFSKSTINIYQMGALANAGSFFGAIFATLLLVGSLIRRRKNVFQTKTEAKVELEQGLGLEIVLIIFFTGITIFYQFIDSFSMIRLLMRTGMPLPEAEITKGVFDRAQPLIQLGIVISLSFVSTIMPQLRKKNQSDQDLPLIKRMVRVCIFLAVAETAGLMALMPDINTMLFTNTSGSVALAIYMSSIFFVSLINLLITITSGDSGKNIAKLGLFILSLICKLGLNIYLITRLQNAGSAIATVCSELVILVGIVLIYRRKLGSLVFNWEFLIKTVSAGLIMALTVRVLEKIMTHFWELTRSTSVLINVVLIPIGVVVFIFLAIQWKILSQDEWQILPFGKKISKFINRG